MQVHFIMKWEYNMNIPINAIRLYFLNLNLRGTAQFHHLHASYNTLSTTMTLYNIYTFFLLLF